MLKILLLCGILYWNIYICLCDSMIGPGKWRMLKMQKLGGDFDEVEFHLSQRKLNRTHDCFQGSMKFHKDLGSQYGARIDICKYVDGGCKQYQVLSDDSFQSMVINYCEENFLTMLKGAGLEKPEFPIPAGEYEIKDYIFNYDELPPESAYGVFDAEACCMKGTLPVGCILISMEFREEESDDDDDDCEDC